VALKVTRKDFLIIGGIGATGLLLDACGLSENEDKSKKPLKPAKIQPRPAIKQPEFDKVLENDPRYNGLRKGFNKSVEKFPKVIALCTNTNEVAEAVKYAISEKLKIAVKSGGHNVEGFSVNDGGMVINVSKMNTIRFIEGDKLAVGPGCTIAQIYAEILPKNYILPVGSCGSVCIGGLTMGGGYGLFSREYGLICDHLIEATFVDGKGNTHSTKDNKALLWALKGGGSGNFGVVTEMIFQLQKAPLGMQAFYFKSRNLDTERAVQILEKWFEFSSKLPNSCFSGFVLNGRTLNVIVMNHHKKSKEVQELLSEFEPFMDAYYPGKFRTLERMVKNYYGLPAPANFKISSAGFYKGFEDIKGFVAEVIDKVIQTPGLIYQVNTFGGNIKNASFKESSCFPHRDYNYISEIQTYWEQPKQAERLKTKCSEVLEVFKENGISAQYVNYCSLEFDNWESAYFGSNYPRLQQVKRQFDPDNNFEYQQSIRL
jgi:hypothetical protein